MDTEQIKLVEQLGRELTPPAEVAALTGVEEQRMIELLSNRLSPYRKAYMKGLAETAHKLRQQMLEVAAAGSPSAIEESIKLLSQCQTT